MPSTLSILSRFAAIGLLLLLLLDVLKWLPDSPAVGWGGLALVAVVIAGFLFRR
jgi:hypothetical protein